jgi:hypothetical protein
MRFVACIVALSSVGCASSPTSDTGPVARCEVTDCFFERDIRDFEVIDRETVVVYVGQQRCPFIVELDGFDCDVSFTAQIQFFQGALGRAGQATSVANSQICASSRSVYLYSGILDPTIMRQEGRMDPAGRRAGPGSFGRPGPGGFGDSVPVDATRDMCRVREIQSINDDQLLELYAEQGVMPPPPPIGGGELEVPEEIGEESAATQERSAEGDEAPAGSAAGPSRREGQAATE